MTHEEKRDEVQPIMVNGRIERKYQNGSLALTNRSNSTVEIKHHTHVQFREFPIIE